MIIPSKHSGYQAGIRLYQGGGGGGAPAESSVQAPAAPVTVAPPSNPWDTSAVNTEQGYNTLQSMKGVPWEKSGSGYNSLLNQGFTSDQIRSASTDMYGKPSEANWSSMVQNAGMTSPTGRPVAGSDQFYQPVYNTSYQNYCRPASQLDVSTYGTQPVQSPASASGMSRSNINNAIGNYFQQNPNSTMSDTLNAMRGSGINRTDIQSWGGVNNYGPQMSMPLAQTRAQQPFNPYTNSSGYGNYMPQMQNPYSPQQPNYQPQMQTPFSYQQPSAMTPRPPMQPPVSQQNYQPSYQPNYGPSALPAYVYDTIRDLNQYKSQPVPQRMSSGPSQAIVGRSSQMRGTPNVMRRAEGGITSLLDQDE